MTSAVVKAHPTPKASNTAWEGALTFAGNQLGSLIQTNHDLDFQRDMEIDLLFSTSGPPANTPMITAIPIFFGNASAGEEAFRPILKLEPISNGAVETPFDQWGAFADPFCINLDSSLQRVQEVRATYRAAGNTSILAEYYPVQKAVKLASHTSSYLFRDGPIHIVAILSYTDTDLNGPANAFGEICFAVVIMG